MRSSHGGAVMFESGNPADQKGVSLLEVLISVLILSVGMLGLAAMQAMALKNNQSAMQRSQGVIYTYSIIDAMRADANNARAGAYDMARTCTAPAGGTLITNAQHDWITDLQKGLGGTANSANACGTIDCSGNMCTITIDWNDAKAKNGLQLQQFKTEARL